MHSIIDLDTLLNEMELLSKRELYELGATNGVSLREAIVATLKRFGIKSMVRGSAAEIHFQRAVEAAQATCVEIDDMDLTKRYDYIVLSWRMWKKTSFEVKMGKKLKTGFSTSISFRDGREVTLPSGLIWRTHARSSTCSHDHFDYLAINLVNVTGRWNDFAYIHSEDFKPYKCTKRERNAFSPEDCKWIEENYWASTVSCRGDIPLVRHLELII